MPMVNNFSDFVSVDDVMSLSIYGCMSKPECLREYSTSALGNANSFNDVANAAVIDWHGRGRDTLHSFPRVFNELLIKVLPKRISITYVPLGYGQEFTSV